MIGYMAFSATCDFEFDKAAWKGTKSIESEQVILIAHISHAPFDIDTFKSFQVFVLFSPSTKCAAAENAASGYEWFEKAFQSLEYEWNF